MVIDGSYEIIVQTPMGAQKSKLTLKTDGHSISGTSESPMGTTEFSGGTINGNEIEWTDRPNTPMGPMEVTFKAAVDGEKISGNVISPVGSFPFEGNRV